MSTSTESFSRIVRCRVCESTLFDSVLDLGWQPLANALLDAPSEDEPKFPLVLVRCHECTTVQLSVDVNAQAMFREYFWVTSTSETTLSHCRALVDQMYLWADRPPKSVLEVASNDGSLLREFKSRGAEVLGVDPAINLANLANEAGISTVPEFFDDSLSIEIVENRGLFDVVVARNVLSHIPNPLQTFASLARTLGDEGILVVEFHRADKILEEVHFDSIYHEHSLYHTLRSMNALARSVGLKPHDVFPSPISGGSWAVCFVHENDDRIETDSWVAAWDAERESGAWEQVSWAQFARTALENIAQVKEYLAEQKASACVIDGFGASARSATIINACGITDELRSVADSNGLKQWRLTPGAQLPIVPPETLLSDSPDVVMLFPFNFESEIIQYLTKKGWSGEVYLPLPHPPRILKI